MLKYPCLILFFSVIFIYSQAEHKQDKDSIGMRCSGTSWTVSSALGNPQQCIINKAAPPQWIAAVTLTVVSKKDFWI